MMSPGQQVIEPTPATEPAPAIENPAPVEDKGASRAPLVDPSAFIIRNGSYSNSN